MATANSIAWAEVEKPYLDFPLFPHKQGYWAKRIRNRVHYFGPRYCDWKTALSEFQQVRDDLYAGREPRTNTDGVTVRLLCNHFLTDRKHRLDAGELSQRSFDDYRESCERIVKLLGRDRSLESLRPDDFTAMRSKLAKRWGPTTLGNEIQRIRVIFNHAWKAELLDRPLRYGPSFRKPSARVMRQHRQEKGQRLFEREQIHQLLKHSSQQLHAMILLAVNAGLGNADCSALEFKHVDLASGWLDYPRVKTSVPRRAKLWNETVRALEAVIASRRPPKADIDRSIVFLTVRGCRWQKETSRATPISAEFRKLLQRLDIYRRGLSFYSLRHQFAMIASETKDQPAIDYVMGHINPKISATYRERIADERLEAIATHVHAWLYGRESE